MKRLLLLPFIILVTLCNAQEYWMQDGSVTTCSGMFYDSGGPAGLFSNNENYTFTICPDRTDDPEYATVITFDGVLLMEFLAGFDYITIYDGDDTSAPVIGTWQGGQQPGGPDGVQASDIGVNPSGCLTVVFISDPAGPGPGWVAEISCQVPCQTITPSVITEPALDGDNTVNITEGETINFNGTATFSQDDSDATFDWDFGDGNTSYNTQNTSYTYTESGTYTATLTVTDASGNPDCKEVFTFLVVVSYDDNVPCPSVVGIDPVSATEDVIVNCTYPLDEDGCLILQADYVTIRETTSYQVVEIPFQPPYPVDQGAGEVDITTDDYFSSVIDFPSGDPVNGIPPYRFCFFNNEEDALVVGANGRISFNLNHANQFDAYSFSDTLPTNNSDMMNSIFGAYHDMNFASSSGTVPETDFSFGFQGTYPCRMFVVNYNELPLFSCTSERTTQQIVLWEGSNYIDVYLHNKPDCDFTNDLVGLQGPNRNQYAVPPGRNTSDWAAFEEAWRFIPDGPELPVTIEWYDADGVLVGTGSELDICPTEDTSYTVQVTYELCGVDPVVVSDQVFVTFDYDNPVVVDMTEEGCDIDGDGEVEWDLLTITSEVIANSNDLVIDGFYTDYRSANEGNDRIENPAQFISGPTTLYVRVLKLSSGCYSVFELELIVLDELTPTAYTAFKCIPPGETEVSFNLFDYNEHFLEGAFYDIYFYLNEADAIANEENYLENTEIIDFIISQTTVVYVRIQTEEGCFGVAPLTLEVTQGPEDYIFETPVVYCDTPAVGEEIVDLTLQEELIANGVPNLTFTYYETLDDAINDYTDVAIQDTTQYNLLTTTNEIYIYVSDASGCSTIVTMPVSLEVGLIISPQSIIRCDIDNDGTEQFNLINVQEEIIDNSSNYTFTYFYTEADAIGGTNPITSDLTSFESEGTQIWVFVEDANQCSSITTVDLVLNATPTINPATLSSCVDTDGNYVYNLNDATGELLDNQTDISLSYYITVTDANENNTDNALTEIDNYTSTIENEIIYVRLDNENCYSISTITLLYNEAPIALESPELILCDSDLSGFETIDLTQNESIITNDESAVSVTYHLSEEDAINAENEIVDAINFNASVGTTTIYVRVQNDLGCFALNSFEVTIADGIDLSSENITLCDNDFDGIEIFDLTSKNELIIEDSENYTIQYFPTQSDLDNDTNEITNVTSYESNETTIFILVSNDLCTASTTLDLTLEYGPEIREVELAKCADASNEFVYNLADATTELLDDPNGITIHYYTEETDAISNNVTNAIQNIENYVGEESEIIYVNLDNGTCSSVSLITLIRLTTPTANQPDNIIACDYDLSGNIDIDLTALETDLLDGQTGLTVNYHLNQQDADNNDNSIANPTSYNVMTGTTTIYIRLDNGSCFTTTSFDVILNYISLENQEIHLCDIGDDGVEDFDLTSMNEEIVSNVTEFTFDYYESYTDAYNNTNAINSDLTSYSSAGEIIYVVATNDADCWAIAELELILDELPTVNTDLSYPLCDPEFDGIYGFELSDLDSIVVSNPNSFNITYYATLEDAENGTNPLSQSEAENIRALPMMVYVRVDKSGFPLSCTNFTSVLLEEAEQTNINMTIPSIEGCDEGNGSVTLDLSYLDNEVTTELTNTFISYHNSLEDAQDDANALDSQNATLSEGNIYVRVHAQGKCPSISEVNVIVNPEPLAEINAEDDSACKTETVQISALDYNSDYVYEWKDETGTVLGIDESFEIYGENGDQSIILVVTNPNTYCYAETEFEFNAIDAPMITALESNNNSINVSATGEGPFEYSIDGVHWQQNTTFENLPAGMYDVFIRTLSSGCIGEGMSTLVLNVSNVITPNGDGYNDLFVIPFMDAFKDADGNVQPSQFYVYDRYGKLMLSQSSSNDKTIFTWDGKFNGNMVNTGDYWYILILADGRKATGHITVKNK